MFFNDFLSRIMRSWKRGCHAKWGIVFRAWVVTADLNPRIMDAKFFDCGPNLFFGGGCKCCRGAMHYASTTLVSILYLFTQIPIIA